MLATRTPIRDHVERVGELDNAAVKVRRGWAPPPAEDATRPSDGDPDEAGISLCERERRWACEWWPPD